MAQTGAQVCDCKHDGCTFDAHSRNETTRQSLTLKSATQFYQEHSGMWGTEVS